MRIKAIRDKFLMSLGFDEPVKQFKKYLDEHSGEILRNLNAFVEAVKPFVIAFTNAAIKVGEFAAAIAKYLGPDATAWVVVAGLLLKFTGMSTVITALATSGIPSLGTALAGLMVGPSGVALRAIAGIAALAGLMQYFNLDTSPEAMKRGHKNENWTGHKHDDDGGGDEDEDTYGSSAERMRRGEAPPPKKKSVWERGKQWFNDKIGIGGAEARETVEGQKGGETPAKGGKPATGKLADNQREAYRAARAEGLSDTAARALVANLTGESLHKPGDYHWDVSHYSQGIAQWDPQRSAAVEKQFGHEPRSMSVADQTRAMIWEIRNNPRFRKTKEALEGGKANADEMIDVLVRNYEVPANPGKAIADRRRHYRSLNVNVAGGDGSASPATPNVAPEVAPQKPVHVPPVKLPDGWENRPQYDYTKPGHPLITPRAASPTTPHAPPHATSPRPIGHSTSNSVRHGDISLNQKTNISVQTPGDAGATARAIAGMQNTVNADAIRNMQGAAH